MIRHALRWGALLAILCAPPRSPAGAQPRASAALDRLAALLQPYGGLSARQRSSLQRDDVDVRVLPTKDRDEIALVGVLRVATPYAAYVARVRDPHAWLDGRDRPDRGFFGVPATVDDVARLKVAARDVAALRTCRPLHCPMKLPQAVMTRLRDSVDWSAAPQPQASALLRQWLVERVNAYRAQGAAALPVYDDTRMRERSADGFAALLGESAALLRDAPALAPYLGGRPEPAPPGVSTALSWSVDRMPGLPPILRVAQRSVYATPARPEESVVAEKLVYADHYFDAMLEVTVAIDASEATPFVDLAVVRRMRFDNLPKPGLFSMRGRIVGKVRDAFRGSLLERKRALEASRAGR